MSSKVPVRVRWLIASVLLVLTAVVPLSFVVLPRVYRAMMIARLTSDNPAQREAALNFVVQRAGGDPAVFQGAVGRLDVPDEGNFIQIVLALDRANMWQRGPIPDDAWLRWLGVLARDPDLESRILAAQFLANLPDLAADPRVADALQHLIEDDSAEVRLNAMTAAGELAGAAAVTHGLEARRPFERMIAALRSDPAPKTARHAWIILGLLNPVSGLTAEWDKHPPEVAEAILWAALVTNPDRPAPAIAALQSESADPGVRRMAAYVLHLSAQPEATRALRDALDHALTDPAKADARLVWRILLAMPPAPADAQAGDPGTIAAIEKTFPRTGKDEDAAMPLRLAAAHRAGPWLAAHPDASFWNDPAFGDPLFKLAALEGARLPGAGATLPGATLPGVDLAVAEDAPPLVRLAAVAAAREPTPDGLRGLFQSDVSTLRDLACVVAADRFSKDQNGALAGTLLKRFDDESKMSGAILAGLTGVRPTGVIRDPLRPNEPGKTIDLLEYRAENEPTWAVKQVINLGLWMQGRPTTETGDTATLAEGLLTRDDVPRTTVLLAMLHVHRAEALDFLFNPRGQPTVDLAELFDQLRWWRALGRDLPADAPPFWAWADPDLEAFQVEVLRDWYLVNRYRLHHEPWSAKGGS
jgi:hypothetical protein